MLSKVLKFGGFTIKWGDAAFGCWKIYGTGDLGERVVVVVELLKWPITIITLICGNHSK